MSWSQPRQSSAGAFLTQQRGSKDPVRAATTEALPANARVADGLLANANGAFPAQDGVTLAVGDDFLV